MMGEFGFIVVGRGSTDGQPPGGVASAGGRELKFDLFFLLFPGDLFAVFGVLSCTSRIDCTNAFRPVLSVPDARGAAPVSGVSDVSGVGATVGAGGEAFHTFCAGCLTCSSGRGVSASGRRERDAPDDRRAHNQAPSTPMATPHSTPTSVDQLDVGAATGPSAPPGAAAESAGARVAGAWEIGTPAAGAARATGEALAALSITKRTVSVAVERGTELPAGGCAHAAGLPLSKPNTRSNSNGRLPARGQPAGWCRLTRPMRLVERLRVMKHLG